MKRYVHAVRARKLRKRGVPVTFSHWDAHCHPMYEWEMPSVGKSDGR